MGAMTPSAQAKGLFLEPGGSRASAQQLSLMHGLEKAVPRAGPLRLMVLDTSSFISLITGPEGYWPHTANTASGA